MALTKEQRAEVVKKFQRTGMDTGSSEVQVALITARINDITAHFAKHKKDNHGRRGLVKLVNQRRKLLDYLKKSDQKAYATLIEKLEIRK